MTESDKKDELKTLLGFKPQKTIIYNKLLPYANEIPNEAIVHLKDIKENFSKAVIQRDIRPGCIHWVAKLSRYIKIYGLCFSKEDHIHFVKLSYQLAIIPDQEFWVTAKFTQMLSILLKKRELISPEELQLPWKPLSEIYNKLFFSSYKNLGMMLLPQSSDILLKNAIRLCRPYFPLSSSAEILQEWRPQFCPYDISMSKAISYLELFLPTMLPPDKAQYGWKLWLDELLHLWNSFHNEPMWGSTLFCLFARLAWQNIGHISWEEHLSLIFTRILWQFHLPVNYKKVPLLASKGLDSWAIAMFIVSNLGGESKTQKEIEHLFKTLESYFHPSNTGYWTRILNDFQMKLTHYFVQRLHNERYRKPSWVNTVTESKKLTEDDVTAFVKCLQPTASLSVFAKTGSYEAGIVLHRLALLRPEIIIPPLIEQLYSALETMTEPHRLIASLQCVVRVARPLVLGGKRSPDSKVHYPEGPTHVIPLLINALPGIDPNDINKCMVTFQFIATFAALVPLVDCSSAVEEVEDLTETEQQVCLQSANFENFVLQFMSRAFALIESSALETTTHIERENESMNLEENMVEIGLSSAFKAILAQSHPQIFDSALERLLTFTKGRCIETKVAGKFIATMCRSAAKVDSDKTLTAFLPGVCRLILALTENPDVVDEENIDDELLFNMLLLSELVQSKGKVLTESVPKVIEVLHRTLHLRCRKGYKMASSILRNLLWSLNLTISTEVKSSIHSWDCSFKEFLPTRHWGEAGDVDNLGLTWSEPEEKAEEAITILIREFLPPELEIIKKVTDGDKNITRDRLHQSLNITQDILYAGAALPVWDEEPIPLIEMTVKRDSAPIKIRSYPLKVTLDSPEFSSNVRKAIVDVMLNFVVALLNIESDDTKAMNYATNIYLSLCFFHGVKKEEFEGRWKSFERVKQALSDSVVRKKQHIRTLLIERTVLQYEMRLLECNMPVFTNTHHKILSSLVKLSTSHYSEVRKKAQVALNQFFHHFSYSYKLILPDLIKILEKNTTIHHKEFKGALYVIHGCKERSLIVRRDWDTLNQLCPALLSAEHSEKPSIVKLYDSLMRTFIRYFELFAIHMQVPESAISMAKILLNSSSPAVSDAIVSSTKEQECLELLEAKQENNLQGYKTLIVSLVQLLNSGILHWRRTQLCLNMLGVLVRPDVTYPAEGVRAFTSFLTSDNIILRKIAISYLPCILKNQKKPHKKVIIDPYTVGGNHLKGPVKPGDNRPDNRWLQYDQKSLYLTEEEWEQPRFVHKTWKGWYCWPKELEVYAPPKEQPPICKSYNELKEEEKPIFEFFSSQDNVDKLIGFLSLEESKGQDSFDTRRFYLFKGLFRNFGDQFLPQFESHLERLVADPQESSQRCASEIVAGMVRGTKHWPYKSSQNVLDLTCRLLKVVLSKVLNETIEDWGNCLMHISMDRDPNRMAPLIELLIDEPIRLEEGSFLNSSRLYLSQLFFEQQEWRIAECYHRLYEALEPHLSNPYKNIRDRIGVFLYRIFLRDETFTGDSSTLSPHHSGFVDYLIPRLAILIQECGSGGVSITDLSSSHHPRLHPVTSDTSLLATTLSMSSVVVHQSLLGEYDESSRPDSPKEDMQDSSLEPSSSMGEHMDIPSLYPAAGDKDTLPSVPLSTPGNGFKPGDSEERKVALRLMNTICKYLMCVANYVNTSIPPDIYKFLPHLCQLESIDSDQELRSNCISALAYLSRALILPDHIDLVLNTLKSICLGGWWRARMAALSFLQVMVFNNMFTIIKNDSVKDVRELVLNALSDSRAEVRQMASQVLSGLFHCNLITTQQELLNEFTRKLNRSKRKREKSTGRLIAFSADTITERHTGALGLSAYINAFPYEVPAHMPEVLITLSEHINDPPPISTDIKQALSDFKRTHYDNWQDNKRKFTSEQLSILTDVLVSPSYYA